MSSGPAGPKLSNQTIGGCPRPVAFHQRARQLDNKSWGKATEHTNSTIPASVSEPDLGISESLACVNKYPGTIRQSQTHSLVSTLLWKILKIMFS